MYVITVSFKVRPEYWGEFVSAIVENAKQSLELEPGCRVFDVCESDKFKGLIFLYEVYDSAAAFQLHLEMPHFLAFNAKSLPWVETKDVASYHRLPQSES